MGVEGGCLVVNDDFAGDPKHATGRLVLSPREPRPIPDDSPAAVHVELREQRLWLDRLRRHHLELVSRFLTIDDVGFFTIDIFLVGVAQRSYHLVDGFLGAFDEWNVTAAAPMIRMQIDSLVRVAYFATAPSADRIAMDVIAGVEFRHMKDTTGKKLTDFRLVELAADTHPWVKPVYEGTSGWVHLSPAHVHNAWKVGEADDGTVSLTGAIPMRPENIPLNGLLEMIGAMIQATEELFGYFESWESRKGLPPGTARDLGATAE